MARPDKAGAVSDITRRFEDAQAALLTQYRGLSVGDMAEVRRALRDADADYKVLKNTLTRIAVRDVGLDELVGMLEGPTAIAFCKGDAAVAAKALDEAARKFPVLEVKGGVLLGRVISAEQARALATLEPREVQLARIAMMLNAPVQQTVNVFAGLLRDLGSMLAQVVTKKESGELPGGSGDAQASEAAARPGASGDPEGSEGAAPPSGSAEAPPAEAEQVGAQTESPAQAPAEEPKPTAATEDVSNTADGGDKEA
jgi:large subunit ribosomal protein L10